jgi:hypothetical protein
MSNGGSIQKEKCVLQQDNRMEKGVVGYQAEEPRSLSRELETIHVHIIIISRIKRRGKSTQTQNIHQPTGKQSHHSHTV